MLFLWVEGGSSATSSLLCLQASAPSLVTADSVWPLSRVGYWPQVHLRGRCEYHPHFADKEAEAERDPCCALATAPDSQPWTPHETWVPHVGALGGGNQSGPRAVGLWVVTSVHVRADFPLTCEEMGVEPGKPQPAGGPV